MVPDLVDPGLALLYLVFWIGMSLLWTPLLAAERVRGLLNNWPTSRLSVNYPLWMWVVTSLHFTLVAAALIAATRNRGANLMELAKLTIKLTVGFVTVVWVGVSFSVPRLTGWTPTGDSTDGRLVLAAGAVWYLACTAVVTLLLAFLAFVFMYQG